MSWLFNAGFNVPLAYFLPFNFEYSNKENIKKIKNKIESFKIGNNFEIAIRSSSSSEDSKNESYAGHYKTKIGSFTEDQVFSKIREVSEYVPENKINPNIGVIIQKRVHAKYAGVGFSSSHLNGGKNIGYIEYIEGIGEELVSGKKEGILVRLIFDNGQVQFAPNNPISSHIQNLAKILKQIENQIGLPVDIEWLIDKNDDLFILQCRPITSIFFDNPHIIPIKIEHEDHIPDIVKNNDKIKIRLLADKYNVRVSQAYLFLYNNVSKNPEVPKKLLMEQTKYCMGYSTVLLHPPMYEGKIQRLFTNKTLEDSNFIQYCHRYGTRVISTKQSVNASLYKLLKLIQNETWTSIIIIQEFWEASYSGIIKRINDSYIIEIARGHFLAKGVVATSSYILNFDLKLNDKNEIYQSKEIIISKGNTEEIVHDNPIKISFDLQAIQIIVKEFKPIIDELNSTIEFALLDNEENQTIPYMYDIVDDDSIGDYTFDDIKSGIVSRGQLEGHLKHILQSDQSSDIINFHYHDSSETKVNKDHENYIFYTTLPDISLLQILKDYNNKSIAFVFQKASILSHFSILLRERKIPAIYLDEELPSSILENDIIKIDANTPKINKLDRIIIVNKTN